jgi:hypothetical protein
MRQLTAGNCRYGSSAPLRVRHARVRLTPSTEPIAHPLACLGRAGTGLVQSSKWRCHSMRARTVGVCCQRPKRVGGLAIYATSRRPIP